MNNLASFPLKDRCSCECKAKIMHTVEEVILFFHKAHTAEDHVPETDKGKFLKFQQKAEITHAVKIAPLQTASGAAIASSAPRTGQMPQELLSAASLPTSRARRLLLAS